MGRFRLYGAIAGGIAAAAFSDCRLLQRPIRRFADKSANATPVDVELVLAVDVSYSMDPEEQALQREGYIQALTSKEFLSALREGGNGKIAVTYFEWAGANDQKSRGAVARDRRAGIGGRLRGRYRQGAVPARLTHLDFRRDPVRQGVVRQ